MKMSEKGLALIRAEEGFRPRAYRDPAGVWTVGYGHTGRAGPPEVTAETRLDETTARALLASEVAGFADAVRACLTRELADDAFSALVSFAYNVGMANFRRSSVLIAANAGDDAAVARRLGLWVKAHGRVLPGLVRRRAAEAALYLGSGASQLRPDVPRGKPMLASTTNLAAAVSAAAGTAAAITGSLRQVADDVGGQMAGIVLVALIVAATVWIWRERARKSREDGV